MFTYEEIRGQQLLDEAEGYLDLILSLSDCYDLEATIRDRLAQRSLDCLDQLPKTMKRGESYYHAWGVS